MTTEAVTLTGKFVQLEPLSRDHFSELCQVALSNPEIWRWMAKMESEQDFRGYFETALDWQAAGTSIPFTIRSLRDGSIVGSTRYLDRKPEHRSLEIGATWLATVAQRTGINVEMKYLMLRHAFESMQCLRVALKTHHNNRKSQAAMQALGAVKEGVFRNHMVHYDGTPRHTVWFSIVAGEWPAVKQRLDARMQRHR